jgi:hypothetical protein
LFATPVYFGIPASTVEPAVSILSRSATKDQHPAAGAKRGLEVHGHQVCATDTLIRITLEIDRGTVPISGTLCQEGSDAASFTGWMELIVAMEAALVRDLDG